MRYAAALLLLMIQWQIGPEKPQVKPDDPRPPYVSSRMTSDELKKLNDAEAEVINRQAELDAAQKRLDDLRWKTVEAHRMKDMPQMVGCSEVGYHGHIDRNYVVWELGVIQCRPI